MFWGHGRMKNKQNILCLNTVQLSTKLNNILGAELVGGRVFRGRVG